MGRSKHLHTEPWLLLAEHQCGGLMCSPRVLVGVILRLVANRVWAKDDIDPLLDWFDLMSDCPSRRRGRPRSDSEFAFTNGSPYTPQRLQRLHGVLGGYFDLPPITEGVEAFIHFGGADPLDDWQGWAMTALLPDREDIEEKPEGYDGLDLLDFDLQETTNFDAHAHAALLKLGRALGVDAPPGAFLLWENSD